jgi:hypothetical protein
MFLFEKNLLFDFGYTIAGLVIIYFWVFSVLNPKFKRTMTKPKQLLLVN